MPRVEPQASPPTSRAAAGTLDDRTAAALRERRAPLLQPFSELIAHPPRSRRRAPRGESPADPELVIPALTPWTRAEGAPRAERPPAGRTHADRGAPPVAPGDRLLLGVGAHRAEARLYIDRGPLAGAEIHLQHGASGVVRAVVLTALESSRKTLLVAMHEVARRLARRGHAFEAIAGDAPAGRGGARQVR